MPYYYGIKGALIHLQGINQIQNTYINEDIRQL